MRLSVAVSLMATLTLTGCSLTPTAAPTPVNGKALQGIVHGGQQPVVGSHVYLFAASTAGYGASSVSLLNSTSTGLSDSTGAYVLTDSTGAFGITSDYTCTPNTQVYVYVAGGDPGAGPNSASTLVAALGNCPSSGSFAAQDPLIQVNELTTVAAAYAVAGFATDMLHIGSSGTTQAQTGIANAFQNAANLVSIISGQALTTTPGGNGTVPTTLINTLGNILAACVSSTGTGSSGCGTVTSTANQALAFAQQPLANVTIAQSSATSPFQPSLTTAPNDWSISIPYTYNYTYTYPGGTKAVSAGPVSMAVDSQGNIWVDDVVSVLELNSAGVLIAGPYEWSPGYYFQGTNIVFDKNGNLWKGGELRKFGTGTGTEVLLEMSPTGQITTLNTLTASGFFDNSAYVAGTATFDSAGNFWAVAGIQSLLAFSSSGSLVSPAAGFTGGGLSYPFALAPDSSGNIWVANSAVTGTVSKFSAAGALSPSAAYPTSSGGDIYDLAVDASNHIYVTALDGSRCGLNELASNGTGLVNTSWGGSDQYLIYSNAQIDCKSLGTSEPGSYMAVDGVGDLVTLGESGGLMRINPKTGYSAYANLFTGGFTGGSIATNGIAISSTLYGFVLDASGNVWSTSPSDLPMVTLGAAAPVVTPLSLAAASGKLGTRP